MGTLQDLPRTSQPTASPTIGAVDQIDLVEWYFEQGWTDGLPVVPPTPETVAAMAGTRITWKPECRRGGAT